MRKILYIIFTCLAPLYCASQMMMANTYDLEAFAFMQRGSYNQNFVQVNTDGSTVRQGGNFMGSIQQLVVDLKRTNLWDSLQVIYPMGSGADLPGNLPVTFNATAYQRTLLNLKATTNTLLSVVGGQNNVAVTTNGMRFGFSNPTNATPTTNQAYNTGVPQNVYGGFNSMSLSVYTTVSEAISGTATRVDIGGGASAGRYFNLAVSLNSPNLTSGNAGDVDVTIAGVPDRRGLFSLVRSSNTSAFLYRNASQIGSDTRTQTQNPTSITMFLGAQNNNGAAGQFTNRTIGYADIGRGISAVGVARKYEIVNRYFQNINRPTF